MTEPADICRSSPPVSVVNAGPCILRPGHRGTIHQDLHGWQWTTPPRAEVLQDEDVYRIESFGFSLPSELDPVSDLDRGENPFGWSSSAQADSSPDRIRTAPDSTRTRQPDTTLTSTDTDPDRPDSAIRRLPSADSSRPGITRYRKLPVEVDTIQWTGSNEAQVQAFTGGPSEFYALDDADRENCEDPEATATVYDKLHSTWILVYTGQHIVRGVKGEHYPIAEEVLAETYERLDDDTSATGATELETTARVLSALHRSAEESVTRVIELHEQWVAAGPPPLGVSLARWWDARLAELHNAIQPADQTTEK